MGIEKYEDILHLPHHVSATRVHRTMVERGTQFSPFAALTGYEDAIEETGRLTDSMVELAEDARILIDEQLQLLAERIFDSPTVEVTYFRPDARKQGGAYVTATERIKKMDAIEKTITTAKGIVIPVESIVSLSVLLDG